MTNLPPTELHVMEKGTYALAGELTFSSVPDLWRKNRHFFTNLAPSDGKIVIDLDKVARTDSAGLVLMLEWLRQANSRDIILRFQNIPKQMLCLANMAEVDFLFDGGNSDG
ncbi:MAG: STAS domain-containing protein [Gammaproteobacteria bacterium]|nr:STAS domain-containing protein [Gammaproteobacteria bacterium]